MSRGRWTILCVAAMLVGCRQQPPVEPSEPASPPSTQACSAPASAPAAEQPEHGRLVVRVPGRRQQGWMLIEAREDGRKEAYAEGRLAGPNRLEVDTRNVSQLRLELGELTGRPPGRLILHIDGQGFEITGARGLNITLQRSGAGAWALEQ